MKKDTFGWEPGVGATTFFGQPTEPSLEEALPTPVTEENPASLESKKEDVEEDIDDDMEFFGITGDKTPLVQTPDIVDEDVEDTPAATDAPRTTGKSTVFKDLYLDLKDQGFFQHLELEDGEDEEIDADRLIELQEQERDLAVKHQLNTWAAEKLGSEGSELVKFIGGGGTVSDFLKIHKDTGSLPQGSIEDEAYQDSVIRQQLQLEGWDPSEIEDRLEYFTDAGTKKAKASMYEGKLKARVEKEKEKTLQAAAQEKELYEAQRVEFETKLRDVVKDSTEFLGFKLPPAKASKILKTITDNTVTLDDGRKISKLQDGLAKVFQTPEQLIVLATLIDNKFDFSQLEKRASSKQTTKTRRILENSDTYKTNVQGSSVVMESLADIFG